MSPCDVCLSALTSRRQGRKDEAAANRYPLKILYTAYSRDRQCVCQGSCIAYSFHCRNSPTTVYHCSPAYLDNCRIGLFSLSAGTYRVKRRLGNVLRAARRDLIGDDQTLGRPLPVYTLAHGLVVRLGIT